MSKRVLVVDDDLLVRNALLRCLRMADIGADLAESSREAFRMLADGDYFVIVSDLKMPEIDGLSLLRWVAENKPATRRILLTGHADLPTAISAVNDVGVFRIIQKPWVDADLQVLIQAAVAEAEAERHAQL